MEDNERMSKTQMNSVRKTAVMLAVAIALTACSSATVVRSPGATGGSSSRPSTVPRPSVPRPGATVTVQRGDTLYAISRRTNITAADLAAWNGLSSPNTIYPGQTLKLYPDGASKPGSSAPVAGSAAPPIAAPVSSGFSWRWPADGVVVGTFVTGETTRDRKSVV